MNKNLSQSILKIRSSLQGLLQGRQKLFAKAESFFVRGKYNEAIKQLELFLNQNPEDQRALVLLGRSYALNNRILKAKYTYRQVIKNYISEKSEYTGKLGLLNFFELDALIKLTSLLSKEKEDNHALEFANLLLNQELIPSAHKVNYADTLNQLAELSLNKVNIQLANQLINRSLEMDKDNKSTKLLQAELALANKQFARAEELFRENLTIPPTHTLNLYSEFISVLEKQGKTSEAEIELEKFKDSLTSHTFDQYTLGNFWLNQEEFTLALNCFENAMKERPEGDQATLYPAIYVCDKELGNEPDKDNVIDAITSVIKKCPKSAHSEIISKVLAECANLNQRNLAWFIAQRCIKQNEADPHLLTEAIILARNFGNFELAEKWIEQGLKNKNNLEKFSQIKSLLDGELKVYRDKYRPKVLWNQPGYWEASQNRVLHILETSLPYRQNGYTYRSHGILKTQQRLGWIVAAVTRPGFPRDVGRVNSSHSTVYDSVLYYRIKADGEAHYFKRSLDQYLDSYAHRLLQICIREQPEVLHAVSNFKNAVAAKAVSDALKIPWIYEMRGVWEEGLVSRKIISGNSERFEYVRNLEDEALQQAYAVTTISRSMKIHLMDRSVPGEKIFIVPHAVDTELFSPTEKNQKLIDQYKLHSGFIFGYIGSLERYEGLDYLLRAAKKYKEEISEDFNCIIIGDGSDLPRLQRIARQLHLHNQVIFIKALPMKDISQFYNLLDLFVLPRNADPICHIETPAKPFEAMSCGKPLLLSGTKALKEIVSNEQYGMTFQPEDVDDLCEKLKLFSNAQLRKKYSISSRDYILKEHTWETVVSKYREAYAYALDKISKINLQNTKKAA